MSQPSLDLDGDFDDGGLPTFSVGELVGEINASLRRTFDEGVWVRGEIQGWRDTAAGHAYFNLVEDVDGAKATLSVSWFANSRLRLRPLLQKHRLRLADGLKIRIHGYLDLYAPTGRLSLKMGSLDPRYTLGELAVRRDEVVRRLVAAGLFDANRARPLALVPLRVGVVTSVGSAAWHDFVDELHRSGIGFELKVVDVRVQGEWAVPMVTGALELLGRYPSIDAVVLIRGGGARSELAVFDAEEIAVAIATCPVPVLTGLGHEIDRSVADDVAHLALKTPTACAGALIERVRQYAERSERAWADIVGRARHDLTSAAGALDTLAHRVGARTRAVVERADERLALHARRVPSAARAQVEAAAGRLERAQAGVVSAARLHVGMADVRLEGIAGRVHALDPAHTLARGWSITRTADGRLVRVAADAPAGTHLITTVSDGTVHSAVEDA